MSNHMPKKWDRLIQDVRKYTRYRVMKYPTCYVIKMGFQGVSLILCEDGTAYRSDVPFAYTSIIRSARVARAVLEL